MNGFILGAFISAIFVIIGILLADRKRHRKQAQAIAMYRERYNLMVRNVRQIRAAKNFLEAKALADAALELKEGHMTTWFSEL